MFTNRMVAAWLAALSLATLAIYYPGLGGGFHFDDQVNIIDNPRLHLTQFSFWGLLAAAFSSVSSILPRPISMLSLALNYWATGIDPYWFKLTNVVIHIATGVSLFFLSRAILKAMKARFSDELSDVRINAIGIAVSAAWLLHPLNLSPVLYVVQRMTSLSALFTIWGMVFYIRGRLQQAAGLSGWPSILSGLFVAGGLAVLSKENGVLLPLFLFIVEWIFLGFTARTPSTRRWLGAFHLLFTGIPLLAIVLFLIIGMDWLNGIYSLRDFTLQERLLTEARGLWFYIRLIYLPSPAQMGLYHDDFMVSKTLFDPPTTLPAVLGIAALAASALMAKKRAPLFCFGVLFFFAGHLMESTFYPLEIIHEHRNYLPDYGLLLPVFYYLLKPHRELNLSAKAGPAMAGLIIAMFGMSTLVRAGSFGNDLVLAMMNVLHHPNSPRSHFELGTIYYRLAENTQDSARLMAAARQQFLETIRLDGYTLNGQFAILAMDSKDNKATDPVLIEELADRLAHRPLASATANALIALNQCHAKDVCRVPSATLWRLFDATLQNPGLKGFYRAQLLAEMTQLKVGENDLEGALHYAEQALENYQDDPQLHLNYANLLLARHDTAGAREQINQAKKLDYDRFYSDRIETQQNLLAELESSTSNPTTDKVP